jgi:hypothetical protein
MGIIFMEEDIRMPTKLCKESYWKLTRGKQCTQQHSMSSHHSGDIRKG